MAISFVGRLMIAKRARAHNEFVVLPAKYKKGSTIICRVRLPFFLLSTAYSSVPLVVWRKELKNENGYVLPFGGNLTSVSFPECD